MSCGALGIFLLFLVLLYDKGCVFTVACSAYFTNLDVAVQVDHSTNIGDVIYTLENGNDTRSIEMESYSYSGWYGLNPLNSHEVIVKACVVYSGSGSELIRFKISGDSSWCGNLLFTAIPAVPQFTNPTEIIRIGTIGNMHTVDVVQITFSNDQCADFDCLSVKCINDPSQSFTYYTDQTIRFYNYNSARQYGVAYKVEVTCSDKMNIATTNTLTLTVVFYETAPTSTITISTTTMPTSTSTTPPRTSTKTANSTSPSPLITTPGSMITPSSTMATPGTTEILPISSMTMPYNTTGTPTSMQGPPTTPYGMVSTHIATHNGTMPDSISVQKNHNTLQTYRTTSPTSFGHVSITIETTPIPTNLRPLDVKLDVSDLAIFKIAAITIGAAVVGIGLLGCIVILIYRKCTTKEKRIVTPEIGKHADDDAKVTE